MKQYVVLSAMLLGAMTANAQYVDEAANVQKSYSVEQLVDTMKTLSLSDIGTMDWRVDNDAAPWSRENLHAALKQLKLKWVGPFGKQEEKVQIKNPKRKKLKGLNKFLSEEPEYIDSIYHTEIVGGWGSPKYDADIFKTGTFKITSIDNENVVIYNTGFTVTDENGNEYKFHERYLNDFAPTEYIAISEKRQEEFMKGVEPAKEYTPWDCKSDFGEWYMSIYNNESLRPKLKEMQFISLMTGETVDGLQVEFEGIKKNIGGKIVVSENAKFKAVKFPNNMTRGDYQWMNIYWIPSVEIDQLNTQLAGKEVIRPEFKSQYHDGKQDKPQIITKIKRFIVTDKETYHIGDGYYINIQNLPVSPKFCLAAEMEMGDKIAVGDLSIKEVQAMNVAKVEVLHDWYDYKIYNETVLIPAKQRAAEWEKQKVELAKQRAADLKKYTAKYGAEIAKALVDYEVVRGMTLDMVTNEMGWVYEIYSTSGGSTIVIIGPAAFGKLAIGAYKCVVVNNKITMVQDICPERKFMKALFSGI